MSVELFCGSILGVIAPFSTHVTDRTLSNAMTATLGANLSGDSCDFRVWAPAAKTVTLRLMNERVPRDWPLQASDDHCFPLQPFAGGGDRYFYIVYQNKPVPDPVS